MTRIRFLALVVTLAASGCATAVTDSHDATGSGSAGSDAAPPPAPASGYPGHGFVAGGVVAGSAHYKLVGTLTSGKGNSASAHYTDRAGVLGATQK